MIRIRGGQFIDEHGRTLMLRGVNLGGSSKVPAKPDGDTRFKESLRDPRAVSFVGRPFPLEEADEHFGRLRRWGFTFLRFLVTWEAVEHAGPGIYDQAYLDYLHAVVRKAADHGISLFIDPHQDVWSRFTGGDGAPAWTLESVGMDPARLAATGAAVLQCESGDFYPPLYWAMNAVKLGAATLFTLFFAGNDFAPQIKIDGQPVQDFLQGHYIESMRQVALRLRGLPNVFGFDTLNEPNSGYIGWADLAEPFALGRMGFNPSPYQSMLLAAGFPQELDFWKPGLPQAKSLGKRLLNPDGMRLWRDGFDCVWKQHGVWDLGPDGHPRLLRPDYFTAVGGRKVDFNQDYLRPFANRYAAAIRTAMPEAAIFVESMPGLPPPKWGADDARAVVHAPHWYDLFLIATNDFFPWLALDDKTGKLVFGAEKIRANFAASMARTKEGGQAMGGAPVFIGEFGISFDIKNKRAFRTGDFGAQTGAMDRTFRAMEDNLLSGAIWDYTADNTNDAKDKWNAQDYSIFSRSQQADPADLNSGGRALTAVVRPYPMRTAGEPLRLTFDPRDHVFEYEFRHDPAVSAPTEIFLPELHYPHGCEVVLSDGSFEIDPASQTLTYRHTPERATHRILARPRSKSAKPGEPMKIQTPRQYLKDAVIWGGGINLFLNLLAGWLIYRKTPFIPMEGQTSIRGDTTVMVFLIVFFSLLLAVPGIKKAMKEGKLLRYENARPFPGAIRWFLGKGLIVATVVAFLCVFTLVPLVVWLLGLTGIEGLATWPFLGYKTVLATLTAATVVPLIDWLVIKNESAKK